MGRPLHVLKDRYELHKKLARGGMAEVFLARDRVLDRPVAVKIMFPEFATDPTFVERFRREAQSAAKLTHPNIVAVYDWGEERGTYFLVMEYVNGRSVSELLRRDGPFAPKRAAEIASDVAAALGAAHAVGVIHRDIKPGNIMVTNEGPAKVTDFGIARLVHDPDTELTKVGSVMGTATYFSPEQAQGFALDGRSDLYSLGGVLFEMLTGRPPFSAETPVAIAYKHVQERPPRPASIVPGIPLAIEAITLRLLTKNPDSRYDDAQQLVADLRRFRAGQQTMAERALQRPAETDARTQAVTAATGAATLAQGATPPEADHVDDADHDDYEPEHRTRTGVYIALLATLIALLVALGLFLKSTLTSETPSNSKLAVPAVAGKSETEATQILTSAGFDPTVEKRPDAKVAANTAIGTDPAAGTKIETTATLKLLISTGPPQTKIPRVIDRTEADARQILTAAGFTNITVTPVVTDQFEIGVVANQTPAPDTPTVATALVTLQVSQAPADVSIPDVSGETEAKAIADLEAAGFQVGSTSRVASNTQKAGRAIGTDPSGTAPKGSTVRLIVSSGPKTINIPPVRGLSQSDATAKLQRAGFVVDVQTQTLPAGSSQDGLVLDVSPPEGDGAAPNSTVVITVGIADTAPPTTTPPTTAAPTTAAPTTAPPTTAAPTTTPTTVPPTTTP